MNAGETCHVAGKEGEWRVIGPGSLPGLWLLAAATPDTGESIEVHQNRLIPVASGRREP